MLLLGPPASAAPPNAAECSSHPPLIQPSSLQQKHLGPELGQGWDEKEEGQGWSAESRMVA